MNGFPKTEFFEMHREGKKESVDAEWCPCGEEDIKLEYPSPKPFLRRREDMAREVEAHGGCLRSCEAKKDATSCEKPRSGAHTR